MATYAIGDVQGCFAPLQQLLLKIAFNPDKDTLWFTGDLVNRGPQSLEVLRFVKRLGSKHKVVLGNHDLNLLACAYGMRNQHPTDTLDAIFLAEDKDELLGWLRGLPLLVYDANLNYVMTHAGLAPMWTLDEAKRLALEVESELQSDVAMQLLLKSMYGDTPDSWNDALFGMDRLRCIVNYFTRMRFCDETGRLHLEYKGNLANAPQGLVPWYKVLGRQNTGERIIFGHWAALGGVAEGEGVFPLDTGCVWGGALTAMRLEDGVLFSCDC